MASILFGGVAHQFLLAIAANPEHLAYVHDIFRDFVATQFLQETIELWCGHVFSPPTRHQKLRPDPLEKQQ